LRFRATLILVTLSTSLCGTTAGWASGAGAAAGGGCDEVGALLGAAGTSTPRSFFSASSPPGLSAPMAASAPRSWSSRLDGKSLDVAYSRSSTSPAAAATR
jgi:hypothetical protein